MNADEEKWPSPKYREPVGGSFISGRDQRFLPVFICVHLHLRLKGIVPAKGRLRFVVSPRFPGNAKVGLAKPHLIRFNQNLRTSVATI